MIHHRFGKIDFRSENLDIEMLIKIEEEGSYYLELTPEGQKELFGLKFRKIISIFLFLTCLSDERNLMLLHSHM